jgi:amino acid transporter
MALVLAVYIGPTLAISSVVPAHQISAFDSLFTHFGIGFAVPLIAIALAVGVLAGMMSWLDGPSEGLLLIGRKQGFLPPYFQKVNRSPNGPWFSPSSPDQRLLRGSRTAVGPPCPAWPSTQPAI